MSAEKRPAAELFAEAEYSYRERHQACRSCTRPHCVFYSVWDHLVEYRCFLCGSCVTHDQRRNHYEAFNQEVESVDLLHDEDPTLLERIEDHPVMRAG